MGYGIARFPNLLINFVYFFILRTAFEGRVFCKTNFPVNLGYNKDHIAVIT